MTLSKLTLVMVTSRLEVVLIFRILRTGGGVYSKFMSVDVIQCPDRKLFMGDRTVVTATEA